MAEPNSSIWVLLNRSISCKIVTGIYNHQIRIHPLQVFAIDSAIITQNPGCWRFDPVVHIPESKSGINPVFSDLITNSSMFSVINPPRNGFIALINSCAVPLHMITLVIPRICRYLISLATISPLYRFALFFLRQLWPSYA